MSYVNLSEMDAVNSNERIRVPERYGPYKETQIKGNYGSEPFYMKFESEENRNKVLRKFDYSIEQMDSIKYEVLRLLEDGTIYYLSTILENISRKQ